ncbi:unannotated protein [freshwater metagenome]|uniref:Unannotated protein n=1 Tax=freshwater metagenome TaxID=449393 RepID=A0A6J7MNY8_9ZZZZ
MTIALSAVIARAPAAAVNSPTECPAVTPTLLKASDGCGKSESAPTNPAATISGCALAVSLISSASAVVPKRIKSTSATADHQDKRSRTRALSTQGLRKPGVCAP